MITVLPFCKSCSYNHNPESGCFDYAAEQLEIEAEERVDAHYGELQMAADRYCKQVVFATDSVRGLSAKQRTALQDIVTHHFSTGFMDTVDNYDPAV